MNVVELSPPSAACEPFRRDRTRYVPDARGCYVLTTVEGRILYIGLASSLCARFNQHLDNPAKVKPTAEGRAALFQWRETDELEQLERGWLNAHRVKDGKLPILNKHDSPVSC